MKTSSASFAALCSLWPFVISCFDLQCEEDVLITHVKTHNTPEHYPVQAIYDSEPQRRFDLANPRTGRPAPLTGISPCVLTSCCGILTRGENISFSCCFGPDSLSSFSCLSLILFFLAQSYLLLSFFPFHKLPFSRRRFKKNHHSSLL